MNSYNENLHSTVVASLVSQELEQKKVKSQVNASMFTLHYAEGAMITSTHRLGAANEDMDIKAAVKKEAVNNSNASKSLLSSITQGDQYCKQSVANTAVCAANVQTAASAIVRLASDLGSIFSIVNAADFDTDIYDLAYEVHNLTNDTAYTAEEASQLSMEASILISKVSSPTVLDKSKATDGFVNNLLKIASTDFENAAQAVATQNAAMASTSAAEKLAEGSFEDNTIDYIASSFAYGTINKQLNLDLTVAPQDSDDPEFDVMFNLIKSPFEVQKAEEHYPVKDYYVIAVKDSKKSTFSLSSADAIFGGGDPAKNNQLYHVTLKGKDEKKDSGGAHETASKDTMLPIIPKHHDVVQKIITRRAEAPAQAPGESDDKSTAGDATGSGPFLDSDGEEITFGVKYVVFVLGVFYDDYKKRLNTFDDFLSAPSAPFLLSKQLKAVTDVKVERKVPDSKEPVQYVVSFKTTENPDNKVEYRCMFLHCTEEDERGQLTTGSFSELLNKSQKLEGILDNLNPKIASLQKKIIGEISDPASKQSLEKDQAEIKKLSKKRDSRTQEIAEDSENTQAPGKETEIPFFFNVTLAEAVSSVNYQPAEKRGDANDLQAVFICPFTDNFGNLLINGKEYVPVVLSISASEDENNLMYSSALSDFSKTPSFTFNDQKTN